MIGVAAGFMLCEISSIFLSFKLMADTKGNPKEKKNTPFQIVNQLLFLLTFTFFRVIFFPFLGIHIAPGTMAVWDRLPWWRIMFTLLAYAIGLTVTILNVYWFVLIIRGVIKMCQAIGCIEAQV